MSTATSITVRVPLKIRRRPGRKTVVMPSPDASEGSTIETCADPALLKAVARAFRYQKLLDEGRYASISEMAAVERIERGYLGSLLRLTLLAPEVVEAIINGRGPANVTLPRLLEPFPMCWAEQRRPTRGVPAAEYEPACASRQAEAKVGRNDRSSSTRSTVQPASAAARASG